MTKQSLCISIIVADSIQDGFILMILYPSVFFIDSICPTFESHPSDIIVSSRWQLVRVSKVPVASYRSIVVLSYGAALGSRLPSGFAPLAAHRRPSGFDPDYVARSQAGQRLLGGRAWGG